MINIHMFNSFFAEKDYDQTLKKFLRKFFLSSNMSTSVHLLLKIVKKKFLAYFVIEFLVDKQKS